MVHSIVDIKIQRKVMFTVSVEEIKAAHIRLVEKRRELKRFRSCPECGVKITIWRDDFLDSSGSCRKCRQYNKNVYRLKCYDNYSEDSGIPCGSLPVELIPKVDLSSSFNVKVERMLTESRCLIPMFMKLARDRSEERCYP